MIPAPHTAASVDRAHICMALAMVIDNVCEQVLLQKLLEPQDVA